MKLRTAPNAYDGRDQREAREAIEREFDRCLKFGVDNIIPNATRIVLTSPNGTKYALSVSNAGVLSAVAYP